MIKVYPHELIGQDVEIMKSTNPSQMGIKGKIIDETKETLKIEKNGRQIVLLKKTITFKLSKTGEIISGRDIAKRPEDRLKGR